jgi:hypothetical protein
MIWFGGKAVFRVGYRNSQGTEAAFCVLEERIVILNCKDADDALLQLETLADGYASDGTWIESSGQWVETRRLDSLDVYRIDGSLESGTEVYSRTEVAKDITDEEVIERLFGKEETEEDKQVRKRLEPDFRRMTQLASASKDAKRRK